VADYETLYPGRFLKKETLASPKTIRIVSVQNTVLEGEKGAEQKAVLKYKAADGEGEIVWCKTNAILTAYALGERDVDKWAGRKITIHNNPQVDLKGKKVGGIRVFGSPEMTEPMRVEVKRPRRKNPETYNLVPTGKNAKAAAPTPAPTNDNNAPPPEHWDAADQEVA
jgi:hypothetical protein